MFKLNFKITPQQIFTVALGMVIVAVALTYIPVAWKVKDLFYAS